MIQETNLFWNNQLHLVMNLSVSLVKQLNTWSLTLWVPEILENSIFGTPITPQLLKINNLGTTSAKSINLHTIRKLIKCSLKNVPVKAVLTLIVSEILLFEGRLVLLPTLAGYRERKGKSFSEKSKKIFGFCWITWIFFFFFHFF